MRIKEGMYKRGLGICKGIEEEYYFQINNRFYKIIIVIKINKICQDKNNISKNKKKESLILNFSFFCPPYLLK